MPIQNEKFSLLVSDSSGNPLTGSLVELRKDATIYTCSEVGNGWYSIASVPTGKYSVFVDSVDTGETKAVGSGQIAALGNTADNVPVSNATEYDFQDPTTLKTTLSLENVTNVAVPSPTGSDANKIIQVDSNGDYVLSSIAASGFESVYEILTTADLTAALSAEYDSKLLVITREDFNFTNAQTFEVWGSCSIIVANTSEPFQWSSNAVNATFNLKSGADASLTGMFFLNGVIAFGDTSDYTLNIPWKVTNLDFISPEVSRSVDGSSTLTYELLKASIPVSVTVTTAQDWWQNSAGDKLDSVVAGTNVTIDNTDPQNPVINVTATSSPGGSDTQVQFNDGGAFGGDAGLTYNKTTDKLTVGGDIKGENFIGAGGTTTDNALSKWNGNLATFMTEGIAIYGLNTSTDGGGITVNSYYDGSTSQWKSLSAGDCQLTVYSTGIEAMYRYTASATNEIITWVEIYRIDKDGNIGAQGVLNLGSTANASPVGGDIWYDGTDVNIQGNLDVSGDTSTSEINVYNQQTAQNRGITSLWNTDGSTTSQRYATLKQQDTYARLTAGSAALAAANELRIEVADSSGTEQLSATFTDSKVTINDVLNLTPRSSDPSTLSDGDIWYNSTSGTFKCRANGVTETIAFV